MHQEVIRPGQTISRAVGGWSLASDPAIRNPLTLSSAAATVYESGASNRNPLAPSSAAVTVYDLAGSAKSSGNFGWAEGERDVGDALTTAPAFPLQGWGSGDLDS